MRLPRPLRHVVVVLDDDVEDRATEGIRGIAPLPGEERPASRLAVHQDQHDVILRPVPVHVDDARRHRLLPALRSRPEAKRLAVGRERQGTLARRGELRQDLRREQLHLGVDRHRPGDDHDGQRTDQAAPHEGTHARVYAPPVPRISSRTGRR